MGSQPSHEVAQPKISDWSMPDDDQPNAPPIESRTPSAKSNQSSVHPDQIKSIVIQTSSHTLPVNEEDDDLDNHRHDKYLFILIIDLVCLVSIVVDQDCLASVVNAVHVQRR